MTPDQPGVCVRIAVERSGPPSERDDRRGGLRRRPVKRRLDLLLAAWDAARRPGEELVVTGIDGASRDGVRFGGRLAPEDFRALLRRARAFVAAPAREDYGIARSRRSPTAASWPQHRRSGRTRARDRARIDPRLVADDLAGAIRVAPRRPAAGLRARALEALAPFRRDAVDRVVADELLPRLLG
jgi:hypothetical protein